MAEEKILEGKVLAERFEAARGQLKAAAFRMLGSQAEAEDAVQEAWLRLSRADADGIDNIRGWLTTVVARVCLDMLRQRRSRREEAIGPEAEAAPSSDNTERELAMADSVGLAMLVVLETLAPAERVAFVLHDMFSLSFDEIAPIVGRSPVAARQMASRARRRVQGAEAPESADSRKRRREVVEAFLAASRGGDFSGLLAVLDPDVVLRADAAAIELSVARAAAGGPAMTLAPEIHGPEAVAKTFEGRAAAARVAQIEGDWGLVFAPGGKPLVVFDMVVERGRIVEISLIADAKNIAGLKLEMGA
jgi:RNA polymerase sigma factor (sigma-70 family)